MEKTVIRGGDKKGKPEYVRLFVLRVSRDDVVRDAVCSYCVSCENNENILAEMDETTPLYLG